MLLEPKKIKRPSQPGNQLAKSHRANVQVAALVGGKFLQSFWHLIGAGFRKEKRQRQHLHMTRTTTMRTTTTTFGSIFNTGAVSIVGL